MAHAGMGPWKLLWLGSVSLSKAADQPRPQLPGELRDEEAVSGDF